MFHVFNCLVTQHDWRLLLVAALICLCVSLIAVRLLHRAQATAGQTSHLWILTAGSATGFGMWATHFVAMLAYDPGIPVAYTIGYTAISLLIAIAATSLGFAIAVLGGTAWAAPAGGAMIGAGAATMH